MTGHRGLSAISAAVLCVSISAAGQNASASLVWDPVSPESAPAIGGSGTWVTGGNSWRTNVSAGVQSTWTDGSSAQFGEISGLADYVVTLGSDVVASDINFTSDFYTINGNGFGITLNSANPFISVGSDATIAAPIYSSNGLEKRVAGTTLTLGASNGYTGQTHVLGGTLRANSGTGGGNLGYTNGVLVEYGAKLAMTNSADTAIGVAISGGGQLTKSGAGVLSLTGGNSFSGGTVVTAGTLRVAGSGSLGDAAGGLTLGDRFNKGTLVYDRSSTSAAHNVTLGTAGGEIRMAQAGTTLTLGSASGTVTGAGRLTVGGAGNVTINSAMAHTGGLTKNDGGTLTLAGTNTYGGTTDINGGTVLVTGSLPAGSALTLAPGATLGGTGTVAGRVTAHGTISPGMAAGQMRMLTMGEVTWSSDGSYLADISSAGGSDLLVMSNLIQQPAFTIRVDSTDQLSRITDPGTYTWTLARLTTADRLFDTSSINLVLGANLQGYGMHVADVAQPDGTHALVMDYTVEALPEPTAMVVCAVGISLALGRRRRR